MFKWPVRIIEMLTSTIRGEKSGNGKGKNISISAVLLIGIVIYYLLYISLQQIDPRVATGAISAHYSPFYVFGDFMGSTLSVIVLVALLALMIPMLYTYMMYKLKIAHGKKIDENFTNAEEHTYGSAEWMSEDALKKDRALDYEDAKHTKGIIFGMYNGKYVSQNPDGPLNKHILVTGISGAYKTTAFIIPYLYQCIEMGESVIAVDTKGTVYSETVDYAVRKGYTTRVFNVKDPSLSHGFNVLKEVGIDFDKVNKLTNLILNCANRNNKSGDIPFWRDGCTNLLNALILYVNQEALEMDMRRDTTDPKEWNPYDGYGTIGRVYSMLVNYDTNPFKDLSEKFTAARKRNKNHPAISSWKAFAANAGKEDVVNGVIQNLTGKLTLLNSSHVKKMLGDNEINMILPGKQKCIYYINIDELDDANQMLSSIFFSSIIPKLVAFADKQDSQECPVKVNLLCDEFGAIGIIPNWPNLVSGARSRGIRCVMAFQNMGQLEIYYPEKQYEVISANCSVWLSLKIHDQTTAKAYEDIIGTTTVESTGLRFSRDTLAATDYTDGYMESVTNVARPLKDSAELQKMADDEMIMHVSGRDAMILQKAYYKDLPQYQSGITSYNINRMRENEKILHKKYYGDPDDKACLFQEIIDISENKSGNRFVKMKRKSEPDKIEKEKTSPVFEEKVYGDKIFADENIEEPGKRFSVSADSHGRSISDMQKRRSRRASS